jgi:cation diffusion facilitator family transporter
VLAAYTSGLVLLGVALWLAWEGVDTLRHPRPVQYGEALGVAVAGLLVNLASVWLLSRGNKPAVKAKAETARAPHDHAHHDHAHHGHDHGHSHGHSHGHGHDHNFSAAYIHVIADAFTSVLAIAALAGGVWFGLAWLDPAVALLGAAVIGQWAFGVLGGTARALVDATEDPALTQRVRDLIEADGDAKLADLHVWQVGAQAWCAALAVVADAPLSADVYRQRLAAVAQLKHVTVEVHRCPGPATA